MGVSESMFVRALGAILGTALVLTAQDTAAAPATQPPAAKTFAVEPGTHIPLSMVNSISTKTATAGERVYLETTFPVVVNGKIVIPAGSYVMGTVTDTK